jgi:outer membrane lipoprotein SlyB
MSRMASKKWISIILIAGFVSALGGCEYAQQHQGETMGAGVGAAGGAALGLLFGGGARAAIAGGLLGAIAGGVVGHYAENQDRTRQQTAQSYNYQPSQGTMISIERNSAAPTAVRPGETVELKTTYALLTPTPDLQLNVTEERKITHNGELVGNPTVTVVRAGGTYSTSLPLRLPPNAEKGKYKVVTKIVTANASDLRETSFRVD